ncbi:MAG: hypothetical protein JOY54_00615 [Acidobacteriaceae bacterium]|nr:hypothetical protein [Acidobacteriaceae bacterium]
MYHYQPALALEELQDDATLPNPVHVRDMIIRARLTPSHAMELNHKFQEYLQVFGEAQSLAQGILQQLVNEPPQKIHQ